MGVETWGKNVFPHCFRVSPLFPQQGYLFCHSSSSPAWWGNPVETFSPCSLHSFMEDCGMNTGRTGSYAAQAISQRNRADFHRL
jgi:hypothetical protein